MTFSDRRQWAVMRLLPNMQRVTVARFGKEVEADDYAQTLRQVEAIGDFVVVFDPLFEGDGDADE